AAGGGERVLAGVVRLVLGHGDGPGGLRLRRGAADGPPAVEGELDHGLGGAVVDRLRAEPAPGAASVEREEHGLHQKGLAGLGGAAHGVRTAWIELRAEVEVGTEALDLDPLEHASRVAPPGLLF